MFCKEVVEEILSEEKDVITNPKKKALPVCSNGRESFYNFILFKRSSKMFLRISSFSGQLTI